MSPVIPKVHAERTFPPCDRKHGSRYFSTRFDRGKSRGKGRGSLGVLRHPQGVQCSRGKGENCQNRGRERSESLINEGIEGDFASCQKWG